MLFFFINIIIIIIIKIIRSRYRFGYRFDLLLINHTSDYDNEIKNVHILLSQCIFIDRINYVMCTIVFFSIFLLSIINMIAEDWLTLKLSAERDVIIKRAWTARLIKIYSYVTTALAFIFYIIVPYFNAPLRQITNLTDRNKPLPMQTYYVDDTDKSLQFELTFFAQAITVLEALLIYVGVNALLGLVILHMCGQLENFKHNIVNLTSGKDFNKALSSCVVTHLRLIRYANNVENTFTFILFVLVLKFGMVFCLCGFIFLTVITDENINNANFSQISYTVVVLICLLTQTFFYCFGGELITEHCDAVYYTICNLDWYTWKSREAKNLIPLMLLTKEPFRITAGKVLPLTMTTFCSLLKTSAGYVSILLAMRN
ncbi:Odorant receptor 197 [Nylanderia fulva]|uniref:Odorant receptor n=1 Tax=Nylanderia fulva TaxID=613905 RepID=A0A6G1LP25_9HYME|nr:Odorant receptor 197 [Nylanderia fulva]